jgi:hypothetical protein
MLAEVESALEFRLEGSGMAITSFVTIVDMGVYECYFATPAHAIVRQTITARFCLVAECFDKVSAAVAEISLPKTKPLLHFASKLEVLIWPLRLAE